MGQEHRDLNTFFPLHQAIITVMRHFDTNGDGCVTFNEFYDTIMTADDIREHTITTEKLSIV